jgi:hypothetical protein
MTAKLPGDDCQRDWVWDRGFEAASLEEIFAMAAVGRDRQLSHLREDSPFAARKLREAGVGPRGLVSPTSRSAIEHVTRTGLRWYKH